MRVVLMLLLMTLAAPARAEWVKIAESNLRALYYNPAAIHAQGELRRVWTLQDNKQPGKQGALSMRFLSEFDCKQRRQRLLSVSAYAGRMAQGGTIAQRHYAPGESAGEWFDITPDTFPAHLSKLVCN